MNLEALRAQIVRHEGLELRIYKDSLGIPTIGVGRNLQDKGISEMEAMILLENDLGDVLRDLDRELPWWRHISEFRQLVLADMAFNLGMPRLMGFRNTLRAMQEGRWADASREMLDSRWAVQVGSRAHRLARMMETDKETT